MAARLLLVVTVMLAILAAPPAGDAQAPAKVPRIGMLLTFPPEHPGTLGDDVRRAVDAEVREGARRAAARRDPVP